MFKKFKSSIEKQSENCIKISRNDRGKKHNLRKFDKFCEDEGIERQLTIGYTPQQNEISKRKNLFERKNQTVMEMAKVNAS